MTASAWEDACYRTMRFCARGHVSKEQGTMTVLTITIWLALQFPAGVLLGRVLQRGIQPVRIPVVARRRARR
jgi:hypothetical protein